MTNEQFLEGIQRNVDRIREYKLGMDGRNGQCDCIGLIIGAVRLMGGEWKGTHGSNYAARNEVKNFGEITSADALSVGDIVFKAKKPGQSGYALPSKYYGHHDQRDYYHVGVVTRTKPLEITHCTSVPTGIKVDNTLGQWQYMGKLKILAEGKEVVEEHKYRVAGGTLKMRTGPGINYKVIAYVPDESIVTGMGISGNDEWISCRYGNAVGYCMARYLEMADDAEMTMVRMSKMDYGTLKKLIDDAQQILKNAVITEG